jgi:hypothetical protein
MGNFKNYWLVSSARSISLSKGLILSHSTKERREIETKMENQEGGVEERRGEFICFELLFLIGPNVVLPLFQ